MLTRGIRAGAMVLGAAVATILATTIMVLVVSSSASAYDDSAHVRRASAAPAHATLSPTWAFLAVAAVCLTGTAALVILGGHRSRRRAAA